MTICGENGRGTSPCFPLIQIPFRVDLGDRSQSEAQFCYQAISGTYSGFNFRSNLFRVRPKAATREIRKTPPRMAKFIGLAQ